MWNMLTKLLLTLAVGYGLVVLLVFLLQGRLLYLAGAPGREIDATPDDVGLMYEDVWLETADGVEIHGWFVHGNSDRVLLFFHGNAGNISHRLFSIRQFVDLGMSVFIIDYRGYGHSSGWANEEGLYRDAEAAWQYLVDDRDVAAQDIVVFGRSLGGSVAANLAAKVQPRALILESTFTSIPDIAQERYPWLPVRLISRLSHPTVEYLKDVHAPVLIIHSLDDQLIPYHHSKSLLETANQRGTILSIRGTHNNAIAVDAAAYTSGLNDFLASLSSPTP